MTWYFWHIRWYQREICCSSSSVHSLHHLFSPSWNTPTLLSIHHLTKGCAKGFFESIRLLIFLRLSCFCSEWISETFQATLSFGQCQEDERRCNVLDEWGDQYDEGVWPTQYCTWLKKERASVLWTVSKKKTTPISLQGIYCRHKLFYLLCPYIINLQLVCL